MSSDQSAGPTRDVSSTERNLPANSAEEFVLAECALGDLVEELRAVVDKRIARCESLGETATADRYRQAFELARATLEEIRYRPGERS